jgi:hypothetical protein
MRFGFLILFVLFVLAGIANSACGQSLTTVCENGTCVTVDASNQTGAYEYAVRMNCGGFFRHDPAFRGPEVIYKSSGQATPEQANRWWMNSPPHRRLVAGGLINDVQCVGNVCVGRGVGLVTKTTIKQTVQPIRHLSPLKSIRVRLNRCR